MTGDTVLTAEIVIVAAALVGAVALVAKAAGRSGAAWAAVLLIGVTALGLAGARGLRAAQRAFSAEVLTASLPTRVRTIDGFVSSDRCRACHPEEYASWHRSYHRTMTQAARPEAVLGDFDDVTLRHDGRTVHLRRRGDAFWAEMVDPDWDLRLLANDVDPLDVPDAPRTEKRVVMTTGSHHYQAYWVGSAYGNMLVNLPFAWLVEDERWVPREDEFLRPPDAPRLYQQWNTNCIQCHSVAGNPGIDARTGRLDTTVAELGISCEACHGPAAEHGRANQAPARRYRKHGAAGEPDRTIVQPARLDAVRSAQVCGQCHSISMPIRAALATGRRFHAGDDLGDTAYVIRGSDARLDEPERARWAEAQTWLKGINPDFMDDRYWPDGMIRLAGREYNGLIESPCYAGGEFSCLSCHSLHGGDRNDQLAPRMEGDGACLQCHDTDRYAAESHTHHTADSSGSRCYNCHMPHTTYGLLKAIRSHQVDSPTAAATVDHGRPNACNLCHLDRSLAWTADTLESWYGTPRPGLNDDQRTTAASILDVLRGDAGRRALVAWSLGWAPAQEASGRDWLAPHLSTLLDDPYAAVRYVAARALRTLPGYEGLEYDFVGPARERSAAALGARARWPVPDGAARPAVLLDGAGGFDQARFDRLLGERDDRPVELME